MTPSIFLATPTRFIEPEYVQSLFGLIGQAMAKGLEIQPFLLPRDSFLPKARLRCAHSFWKSDCSHLLFVDDDMGFRAEDIFGMLAADKDIVATVGPQKRINWDRVAGNIENKTGVPLKRTGAHMVVNFDGPIVADETQCAVAKDLGTGCMLIKRSVIDKMREGYPELMFTGKFFDVGDRICAMFNPMVHDDEFLTEDFAFCRRWQLLGGQVHAYIPGQLTHVGSYTYEGNLMDQLFEVK